jgi:hypothetical protein
MHEDLCYKPLIRSWVSQEKQQKRTIQRLRGIPENRIAEKRTAKTLPPINTQQVVPEDLNLEFMVFINVVSQSKINRARIRLGEVINHCLIIMINIRILHILFISFYFPMSR